MALAAAVLFAGLDAAIAAPPSIDEIFARLGFSEEDKQAVLEGQIVSVDEKRSRDDQLVAAVALPVDAKLTELAEPLKDGSNIGFDVTTLAWGEILAATPAELSSFVYEADEDGETKALLTERAGGRFNLSEEELAYLTQQLTGLDPAASESGERAVAVYREIVAARAKAYMQGGLDAVAPYEQDDDTLLPDEELRAVEDRAKDFLTTYFPDFWTVLSGYPGQETAGIFSKIYWAKREVEGRPAIVLIHQMVQAGEGFVLTSQRQFYVGHTYESLQMFGLALPFGESSMIFSVNSVFTDQITGFFSGVAQSVGQERTRESMTEHFERVREKLE